VENKGEVGFLGEKQTIKPQWIADDPCRCLLPSKGNPGAESARKWTKGECGTRDVRGANFQSKKVNGHSPK